VIASERTFFGRHYVIDLGGFRTLFDGTTSHGSQSRDPALACEPTVYYTRTGPAGQFFESFGSHDGAQRIGVVGLGTGTLAAFSRPRQTWTFFEINPAVVRMATDRRHFTYLTQCIGEHSIEVGDARVKLTRARDGSFDLLVLDAFSSDAIPVHLVTREAVALYLRKLTPDGVLVFHVSNRFLDIEPVLGTLAAHLSLDAWSQTDQGEPWSRESRRVNKASSTWVVLARRGSAVAGVQGNPRWSRMVPHPGAVPWTDDFSDVLGAVKWSW
jgi:hypothetical protein